MVFLTITNSSIIKYLHLVFSTMAYYLHLARLENFRKYYNLVQNLGIIFTYFARNSLFPR